MFDVIKPYYETENGKLYYGNSLNILNGLESESVQCCITSPPYWGLRDYGSDDQIGLEKTPEEYVEKIVEVFRDVSRVLKDNGVVFLNLGDSYAGSGGPGSQYDNKATGQYKNGFLKYKNPNRNTTSILKPKDLVGIPWRVAFALQADGWWLRSDIIWHKPNPMPESVTDRPTKAHEYIFLLTKSAKYYYNADAIKEPQITPLNDKAHHSFGTPGGKVEQTPGKNRKESGKKWENKGTGRNKRSVWTIPTKPYKAAHFATYPEKLIEPCVLAGTKRGDTILDPFSGAGTTGMVAYKYDRKFIGVELNPEYCEIAAKRIENERKQRKLF